jgi:ABC-type multidrug transport system ATPase subunit
MSSEQGMDGAASPGLVVQRLTFGWPGTRVCTDWSHVFAPGLTVVVAEDGAGKTTLLRLLAAELKPEAGQLTLPGCPAWPQPEAYRQQVFWCDPASDVHDLLSGHGYLQLRRRAHARWDDGVCDDVLAHLELTDHLAKPLHGLSAGMRRKLRMAAAFASGAPLTLLDMPFAALDRRSCAQVTELLQAASQADHRVVVATGYEPPDGVTAASVLNWPCV